MCGAMVQSVWWNVGITSTILANCVLLAIDPKTSDDYLVTADMVFTGIFTVELCLKVVGLGWKGFWKQGANRLDLLVVVLSLLEILVSGLGSSKVFARWCCGICEHV